MLRVPDRSTLKGKRDYVILALLGACGLWREELAQLEVKDIQMREGRCVLADLRGKDGRVRTVAVPLQVRQGTDAWTSAAWIEEGKLLRQVGQGGAEWEGRCGSSPSVRPRSADRRTGGPLTSASWAWHRTTYVELAPSYAAKQAGISSRSSFCSGTRPSRRQNATLHELSLSHNRLCGFCFCSTFSPSRCPRGPCPPASPLAAATPRSGR